jgi:hypothetical protein
MQGLVKEVFSCLMYSSPPEGGWGALQMRITPKQLNGNSQ